MKDNEESTEKQGEQLKDDEESNWENIHLFVFCKSRFPIAIADSKPRHMRRETEEERPDFVLVMVAYISPATGTRRQLESILGYDKLSKDEEFAQSDT